MNVFSIIFSDSYKGVENQLSTDRTLSCIPFGGKYRIIDFMISNLVNAGIHNIGIITRDNYGSLMDHVGYGKDWDLNRKNGGLKVLTPFERRSASNYYHIRGKLDFLRHIKDYIQNKLEDYCIIANGNIIANIDFSKIIPAHIKSGADITLLYSPIENASVKNARLSFDNNGRLTDMNYQNSGLGGKENISLNIYLLKKDFLIDFLMKAETYDWYDLDFELITKNIGKLDIVGYCITGFASQIRSVNEYYDTSMRLLDTEFRNNLFTGQNPIITRVKDTVPTMYGFDSSVKNSLVADGCTINGCVENSIIFRDCFIEEGATVKNSIIMQGAKINRGARLDCVICDKDITVTASKILTGQSDYPFVIKKGVII